MLSLWCTCDTEEGHDGAMGVVSPALAPHQDLAALPPAKASLAGQHHKHSPLPTKTVILSGTCTCAPCSPVSQLCIDTLVGAAADRSPIDRRSAFEGATPPPPPSGGQHPPRSAALPRAGSTLLSLQCPPVTKVSDVDGKVVRCDGLSKLVLTH